MTEHLDYDSLRADIVRQGGEALAAAAITAPKSGGQLFALSTVFVVRVRVVRDKQPRVPAAGGESSCTQALFAPFALSPGLYVETGVLPRLARQQKIPICRMFSTGATGLEPATSGVTGRRSNQLNYAPRAHAL
jgi:hypothetical protein